MRIKFNTFRTGKMAMNCPVCNFMHKPIYSSDYIQCTRCNTKFHHKKNKLPMVCKNYILNVDSNVVFGKFINYDKII